MREQYEPALEPVEQLIERLGVASVFGAPQRQGGRTIIPVASVNMGFGYGFGGGIEDDEEGGGGGTGGGGSAEPRGFIVLDGDGVRYEPILDQMRLGIASMLFSGWIVFWIARTIRQVLGRREAA